MSMPVSMRHSMGVLVDPIRWRTLVREYAALRELSDGITPQRRGQRFNSLIAELFTCFGLTAKANQQLGAGELDVTFGIPNGRRFILEAKWERKKTPTDPIAKLQRRVEQRMAGVTGVFLSMKGYTDHALAEIDKGRRLEILLLDDSHWEAMLSGLVPPPELFELVTDAASYHGHAYTPLDSLLRHDPPTLSLDFDRPPNQSDVTFRPLVNHVRAEVVFDGIPTRGSGISLTGDDGMLLTTDDGVLWVDLATHSSAWLFASQHCHGNPLQQQDGSILVQRANGVGVCRDGRISPLATGGASRASSQLLIHPSGSAWRFDRGTAGSGSKTNLIELGREFGAERSKDLPVGSDTTVVTWLNTGDLLAVGGRSAQILPNSGTDEPRNTVVPNSDVTGVMAFWGTKIVSFDRGATMWISDVDAEQQVAVLKVEGPDVAICSAAPGRTVGSVYLAVRYMMSGQQSRVAVVHVTTSQPWLSNAHAIRPPDSHAPEAQPTSEAITRTVSPPQPTTTPGAEQVLAGSPSPQVPASHEIRLAEERQGFQDGLELTSKLPLFALESALAANFDSVRWMQPWREYWRVIVAGQTPERAELPNWLPQVARKLGSYAAPAEVVDSHFTPSPAYLAGFNNGLREAWSGAVRRKSVPQDQRELSVWLRQSAKHQGKVRWRGSLNLNELRVVAIKGQATSTWKWIGRVTLWTGTLFFAFGTLVAIVSTATDSWPTKGVGTAVGGLLFFSLPFAGLLTWTLLDIRRLIRRARDGDPR